MNPHIKKINKSKGQTLLITVLLLGGATLAAATVAGYLLLLSIRQSTDIADSAKAIYASDTGIEYELYKERVDPSYPEPDMTNGSDFNLTSGGGQVRSLGHAGNSWRALVISP